MGSQLPLTVLQPADPQVADGDPLNPVLQVAVQDESNALLAPHEKLPSVTLGLPTHTAAAKESDSRHWVDAVFALPRSQASTLHASFYCVRSTMPHSPSDHTVALL